MNEKSINEEDLNWEFLIQVNKLEEKENEWTVHQFDGENDTFQIEKMAFNSTDSIDVKVRVYNTRFYSVFSPVVTISPRINSVCLSLSLSSPLPFFMYPCPSHTLSLPPTLLA